jgi:hypothetical protein
MMCRCCVVGSRAEASRKPKQAGAKQGGRGAGGRGAAGAAPSAADMARRREQMAAAAEARQKALMAAAGQQRLWSVRPSCPVHVGSVPAGGRWVRLWGAGVDQPEPVRTCTLVTLPGVGVL